MGTLYISTADTAKIIRKSLKTAFPGTKFSVRSKVYSGGSSVNVGYEDGPPSAAVDAVVKCYAGASFDSSIDLKSYHTSTYEGKQVSFGPDYVFVNRKFSSEACDEVESMLKERINYDERTIHYLPRQNAWHVIATWDARWETLTRAIERYLHQNVGGYGWCA